MAKTMKAAMYYGAGQTRLEEVPVPVPGPGEILMKNISALTCGTDLKKYRRGYRTDKPGVGSIFGHESAGTVYEVGPGVTKFKIGDRIAPLPSAPCNKCYWCRRGQPSLCEHPAGAGASGGWAQYRLVAAPIVEQNTFLIPDNISYRHAAIVEPLSCAVHCIDESGITLMDMVAINGAGPLGLMQVRTAKLRGAYVISCDKSPFRLDCAKKLGADVVINIDEVEDQVQAVRDCTPFSRGVDIAIDCTGLPEVWEMNTRMVRKGGTVMEFGGCKGQSTATFDCDLLHYAQLTIKGLFSTTPRIVEESFNMIVRGEIPEEVFINRTFPLAHFQDALDLHGTGTVVKTEIRCDQ